MVSPFGKKWGKRVDNRILLVFLLLAVAIFIFLKIASEIVEGDTLAFDRVILRSLRSAADPSVPVGPGWLKVAVIDLTSLGGVTVLTLITLLAAGYLWARRRAGTALFLIVAVEGGALLASLLKSGFARPRPNLVAHLVDVHTASFPSGHAMNSAIAYLTLGTLLAGAQPDQRARAYIMSVAVALTLMIGFSRVYLGVHWPSDVIAGWCVGGSWAAICSLTARALQRR
ncbi:phosphatase PAP2 family protein [Sphingobium aquiterrae]|uniref:phosphatase PAP2 family protein n=1 Tax=Sphingobium aquiterrae TaxID=2038656 RepID=UPI003015EA80